ncbi:hypothetical protein F4779DRAFT_618578 [Xylariaceae sp. FL0662B]|nr:hypothetical protein F4779DRAFT_618578 [Xylariaceae sp. FL0662B]
MSYSSWRISGYGDDRRRTYESYKPSDDSNSPRDRAGDRSLDRAPMRRDSREARDPRDFRHERSSAEVRKDGEAQKRLHIDTRVADGPTRSSNNSPASVRSGPQSARPTPIEPVAEKGTKVNRVSSSAAAPITPKASDPRLQEAFESVHKCWETSHELIWLRLMRDKLMQEDPQRRFELGKVASKTDDYAPYSEFQRRFNESDGIKRDELDRRIQDAERQQLQYVERVVSTFASQKPQPAVVAKSPSVSALEVKVEEIQKHFSESQGQVQFLLGEHQKSAQAVNTLQTEVKVLESKNTVLETENSNLKNQLADLRLGTKRDMESIGSRVESLTANKASSADLTQAMSELQGLKTRVEGQAGESNRMRENVDQLSEQFQSSATKQNDVEGKIEVFGRKLIDFDPGLYNEMADTWVGHDVMNQVASLRKDFQSLRKNEVLVKEMRRDIGILQKLQSAPATSSPVSGGVLESRQTAPSDEHLHEVVEEKLKSYQERILEILRTNQDGMIEFCGNEIDALKDRLTVLETKAAVPDTRINNVSPSLDSDIPARVASLESQVATHQSMADSEHLTGLDVRIKSIEDNKFGFRIDRIEIDINKRLRDFQTFFDSFKATVDQQSKDILQRIEALNLSVRTLDSQWSNLSTKQMAERIIQCINPYGQQVEGRITGVENRVGRVEQEVISWATDMKDLMQDLPSGGKRPASPSQLPDDQAKKRRIETNGRYNLVPVLRSNGSGHDVNGSHLA